MNFTVCWCPALVAIWNALKSSLLRSCAPTPAFINIPIIRSWPVTIARSRPPGERGVDASVSAGAFSGMKPPGALSLRPEM